MGANLSARQTKSRRQDRQTYLILVDTEILGLKHKNSEEGNMQIWKTLFTKEHANLEQAKEISGIHFCCEQSNLFTSSNHSNEVDE